MEATGAPDLKAHPTCKICDRGTLMPRKIRRLSGPAVAIGYILLIPSILGMAACAILLIVSLFAGVAGAAHGSALAAAFAGIGTIALVYIGICSFVFGLVGWLLVMKKHVLQCDNCGAVVDAAAPARSRPNWRIGRASVLSFFFLLLVAIAAVLTYKHNNSPQPIDVPFVGCRADGQVGPKDAPIGQYMRITISPRLARKIAYYQDSDGANVLGPRGWYCFETYGSSGSDLYITPTPLKSEDISGYGIDLTDRDGGTSGRFAVARIVARLFPARWDFVSDVIAEGLEPASAFPYGPYPTDKLTYKNKDTVEYVTPSNTQGLGTSSSLVANAHPIEGVVIVTDDEIKEVSENGAVITDSGMKELDVAKLSARLPPKMSDLLPVIIQQVEQESSQSSQPAPALKRAPHLP
jgi:hypothetical protein